MTGINDSRVANQLALSIKKHEEPNSSSIERRLYILKMLKNASNSRETTQGILEF